MQDCCIAIFTIRKDLPDGLTGRYPVAGFYINLTQVAVNCKVITMTDNYGIVIPGNNKYTGYLSIKYGTRICSG